MSLIITSCGSRQLPLPPRRAPVVQEVQTQPQEAQRSAIESQNVLDRVQLPDGPVNTGEKIEEQTPESAERKLKQQGKEIYDNTCMACHQAAAASNLISLSAEEIANESDEDDHEDLNFPNLQQAEAIAAYLNEPL